jgi:hypothetical protein
MYQAAKFATDTFDLFDKKMKVAVELENPAEFLVSHPFFNSEENSNNNEVD